MKKSESYSRCLMWLMTLLLSALTIGCGGGGERDPILGTGGAGGSSTIPGAPGGAVIPGAACTAAGPTVTASNPTSGNQFATTSTNGVAGSGKLITATFSVAMSPSTINSATFTLAPVGGSVLVPASVSYNASTRVATLTTSSALLANTSYTAIITRGAVTSAIGVAVGCNFAWNFKTVTPVATGLAPINLGLASPFAIAATAGVTSTPTVPITNINGNVVLNPTATCNAVAVDNVGGFGLCAGSPPTINGTVVTATFPDTTTANAVQADLLAAFLSITPPAGPPAAGSLSGGTPIAAPTGLGATTGSALVTGQNVFFPGVYISNTSILIANDLTLDAQGNPDAVFVFQSASTVGTAAGAASPGVHTRILLINGAKASNVWWQAGSSATLGTNSEFEGNILASASITMTTGATSCGRLLAGAFTAGAFVFDSNVVSVPGNVNAAPTCQ
ncbi:MAG: ice-binding family protein [Pseudomonadota bacterium]